MKYSGISSIAARGNTDAKFGTPAAYSGRANDAFSRLANAFPAGMPPMIAGTHASSTTAQPAAICTGFTLSFSPSQHTSGIAYNAAPLTAAAAP